MKSLNINQLYNKINKNLLLLESYTEIPQLSFLMKANRLKPQFILNNKTNDFKKMLLHLWWFDEFGNSFKINKRKKIDIIYNDLSIDINKIICTDLYFGLPINKISKISKLVYVYSGVEENTDNYIFITFLGIDNFFRSFMYYERQWIPCSSLLLGSARLLNICYYSDLKFFKNVTSKNNNLFPCGSGQEWISFMPISSEFFRILEMKHEVSFQFLNIK